MDQAGSESTKLVAATGKPRPPNAGMGRKPGVPNKATTLAREAITQLVDANVPKMAGWLEEIEKEHGALMAWRCLETMVEFAVPKLVRSESTVTIHKPEEEASDDELRALLVRLKAEQPPKETA